MNICNCKNCSSIIGEEITEPLILVGTEIDPLWQSQKNNYYTKEQVEDLLQNLASDIYSNIKDSKTSASKVKLSSTYRFVTDDLIELWNSNINSITADTIASWGFYRGTIPTSKSSNITFTDLSTSLLTFINNTNELLATLNGGSTGLVLKKTSKGIAWGTDLLGTSSSSELPSYSTSDSGKVLTVNSYGKLYWNEESDPSSTPDVEYEYVDLGLPSKTLWGTCNIGATNPEEPGYYFAWGETKSKTTYYWSNYVGYDAVTSTVKTDYSVGDKLKSTDDAATVNLGSTWSTPTPTLFQELIDNCTWTLTTINSKTVYKVTGPNNKYIYLPYGGYMDGANLCIPDTAGYYWSSTISSSYYNQANYLYIYNDRKEIYEAGRLIGFNVRGVINSSTGSGGSSSKSSDLIIDPEDAPSATVTSTENYIDLGLPSGTLWSDRNIGAEKADDYSTDLYHWGTDMSTSDVPSTAATTLEWIELFATCSSYNDGTKIILTGPNGNSIYLPITEPYNSSTGKYLGVSYWSYYFASDKYDYSLITYLTLPDNENPTDAKKDLLLEIVVLGSDEVIPWVGLGTLTDDTGLAYNNSIHVQAKGANSECYLKSRNVYAHTSYYSKTKYISSIIMSSSYLLPDGTIMIYWHCNSYDSSISMQYLTKNCKVLKTAYSTNLETPTTTDIGKLYNHCMVTTISKTSDDWTLRIYVKPSTASYGKVSGEFNNSQVTDSSATISQIREIHHINGNFIYETNASKDTLHWIIYNSQSTATVSSTEFTTDTDGNYTYTGAFLSIDPTKDGTIKIGCKTTTQEEYYTETFNIFVDDNKSEYVQDLADTLWEASLSNILDLNNQAWYGLKFYWWIKNNTVYYLYNDEHLSLNPTYSIGTTTTPGVAIQNVTCNYVDDSNIYNLDTFALSPFKDAKPTLTSYVPYNDDKDVYNYFIAAGVDNINEYSGFKYSLDSDKMSRMWRDGSLTFTLARLLKDGKSYSNTSTISCRKNIHGEYIVNKDSPVFSTVTISENNAHLSICVDLFSSGSKTIKVLAGVCKSKVSIATVYTTADDTEPSHNFAHDYVSYTLTCDNVNITMPDCSIDDSDRQYYKKNDNYEYTFFYGVFDFASVYSTLQDTDTITLSLYDSKDGTGDRYCQITFKK